MTTKKILVTGGAGYTGAILVPKLLDKGYKVTVLDWYLYGNRVFEKFRGNNLIEIKGDLGDKNTVKRALEGTNAVIHLACISNDPSFELNPKLGKSINYDATIDLVNGAKKEGVSRFVYASSSSVYGIKKEDNVTEDLPLEPLTDYSKYKVLCEKYLLSRETEDFTVLVLRPATICGFSPRLRLDLTVNLLTINALINRKMVIFGGSQMRPNIHIEDITDLYVKTLEYDKKKIAGKIYNAGFKNYSVLEIAQLIRKALGGNIRIEVTESDDNRSYKISSEKIAKELGFIPQHSIEEAILDLKKAYEKGLIPNALSDVRYYNIRMMQKAKLT